MSGAPSGRASGAGRRRAAGKKGSKDAAKAAGGNGTRKAVEAAEPERGKMVIARTFKKTVEEVWDLWTTAAGIESWWGSDGFMIRVNRLDIKPGGGFEYATKAIEPAQIEALKLAGLPPTSRGRGTYTEVVPLARLGYKVLVDYIPEIPPYEVQTLVELKKVPEGVLMTVTQEGMHDPVWTQAAATGLDMQISRLVGVLSGSEGVGHERTPGL